MIKITILSLIHYLHDLLTNKEMIERERGACNNKEDY